MGQVAYASSKAGVAGMVLPMARDLANYGPPSPWLSSLLSTDGSPHAGIRVLAIAPSIFETAMGAQSSEKCAHFPLGYNEF
jgi:NAD(P)-dependent dehydrogenase (short-subunit alcohol dehydrogenase family)